MPPGDISNAQIAAILSEAAVLLELSKENLFRVRAYQKAAQIIEVMGRDAAGMSQKELMEIRGIGKSIAAHIADIVSRGTFSELSELRARYPKGLIEILDLHGIGPRKAAALYEKLGIDSVEKLRVAAENGVLAGIEGFGPKAAENIMAAIRFRADSGGKGRLLYWEAKTLSGNIIDMLERFGVPAPVCAGSLRRGRETVGDIDILSPGRTDGSAVEKFLKLPLIQEKLSSGPAKASVLLKGGVQCDFRSVPPETFGAALNYFTGSKEHNVLLREIAVKKGFTLSEYGLCLAGDKEHRNPLASRTEKDVYEALGMSYIPPELREGRDEIALALKRRLPKLIELRDILGDAHNHTSFSDGKSSMEEMLSAAADFGFKWFFCGDHSVPLAVAGGLDWREYERTRERLRAASRRIRGLRTGRSIEMEILKDGRLGFSGAELEKVDLVIGAVHSSLGMAREEGVLRLIKAMGEPCLDVIAHPSGRLLGRREGMDLDYAALFAEAARRDVAFEINGQPDRQDLTDITARQAKAAGVKLLLSTDAHTSGQLECMKGALNVARRAGLEKGDILNSLEFEEVKAWIAKRRSASRK